jgi:glyoxylase-like metal-dependent hydrolase (beta-lactamase superfamily II)
MLQIKQFTFSPLYENTYVLYNEEGMACIIDPGCYYVKEAYMLEAYITKNKLKVVHILLTHAHLDHVFGLKRAAATYNLLPQMHRLELQVLERAPWAAQMYNLPFEVYTGALSWVDDLQVIKIGNDELEVIFAPGHAPGHVCYYCKAQGFIIGGDVLFRQSIGRTDLPGGDHNKLINSIKTRIFCLPENTVVHSGHGPETTIGFEKIHNPFLH